MIVTEQLEKPIQQSSLELNPDIDQDALLKLMAESGKIAKGVLSALLTHKGRTQLLIIVAWLISSCTTLPPAIQTAIAPQVVNTQEPSPTPIKAPTEKPPKPSATPSPEATQVSTKLEILDEAPPEMAEYFAQGLDKQTLDGESMKVVMLESTTKTGEVKWKNKLIQVWTEVLFTINGQPVRGIVVNQWFDFTNGYTYVLEASNGVNITKRSPKAVDDSRAAMLGVTPSDAPIVTLEFGSTGNDITDKVFEGALPLNQYTGKDDELVFIEGVGWVLPATHIDIRDAMSE